jgi:hypothetical protein
MTRRIEGGSCFKLCYGTGQAMEASMTSEEMAALEYDLETALRAYETGRQVGDPPAHMRIYESRVALCRDAVAEARKPRRDTPPPKITIER